MKRNFFVVLSGCLAAAAVFGWMRPTEPATDEVAITSLNTNTEANTAAPLTTLPPSDIDLSNELAVLDASHSEALKALAQAATQANLDAISAGDMVMPIIKLATPDAAPALHPENLVIPMDAVAQAALLSIQQMDELKTAKQIAIVNIADNKVIASSNAETVQAVLAKLPKPASQGTMLEIAQSELVRWHWHCTKDQNNFCLLAEQPAHYSLTGNNACLLTSKSAQIACGNQTTDAAKLFSVSDCDAQNDTPLSESVKKVDLGNGCTLTVPLPQAVTVNVPIDPSSQPAVEKLENNLPISLIAHGILALGVGILVILIGVVCTRRKETHIIEDKTDENENNKAEIKRLQEQAKSHEIETNMLKDQVEDLTKDKTDSEAACTRLLSENAQLKNQLAFAKQTFTESNDTIQQLKDETERLKKQLADAIADAAAKSKNDSSANPHHSQNDTITSKLKTEEELEAAKALAANVPATPTRPIKDVDSVEESVSTSSDNDEPQRDSAKRQNKLSLFDDDDNSDGLFPDDGWDDIAASFDALFTDKNHPAPKQATTSDADKNSTSATQTLTQSSLIRNQELVELTARNDSPTNESVPILTQRETHNNHEQATHNTASFLTALSNTNNESQTKTSVISSSNLPRITQSQPISSGTSNETLKPVPSLSKPADSATQTPQEPTNSFKPSPSWTGSKLSDAPSSAHNPNDSGLNAAALLEAAKKRARDVSELNQAVSRDADPSASQSGALNFNRSMSKSGVFSVTGSRANIRLKSDPEYFKELYAEYSAMQKQNGEPQKYNCEQFVTHMAAQKANLIKTYNCRDVKFTIYMKNGKTSIKANPIRDKQ